MTLKHAKVFFPLKFFFITTCRKIRHKFDRNFLYFLKTVVGTFGANNLKFDHSLSSHFISLVERKANTTIEQQRKKTYIDQKKTSMGCWFKMK